MRTFGTFLTEKNLISRENLLDCCLEQINSVPTTCQLMRDKHLLSSEQILQALEIASQKEIGFKEACQEIGLWSDDLNKQIRSEILSVRTPLSTIILRRGLISLTDLTKALDEFLSDDENLES